MPTDPTVELWTLYTLGVCFTVLRTYARVVAVGFRKFHADDYLIWLAMVCFFLAFASLLQLRPRSDHCPIQIIYTAQCTLGHSVGAFARGLANNGMTDAQRSALSHDDPEYTMRYDLEHCIALLTRHESGMETRKTYLFLESWDQRSKLPAGQQRHACFGLSNCV
jgi:hypothetical protein